MTPVVIKIIAGFISTIGFAVLFRLRPMHWLLAGVDGLIACICYFAFLEIFDTALLPNLIAAFACALFAEILARIAKAPTTVFLLPGIIALVPGGTLYYTMSNLLNENYVEAGQNLLLTAEVAIAIAGGIIGASVLRIVVFKTLDAIKLKLKRKK